MSEVPSVEKDAILGVLRRHGIGAFNGSQVACSAPECRVWMSTDLWRQHQTELISETLTRFLPPSAKGRADA